MGLIKKVAALGAVAAAGMLAANRDKVKQVVKGALAKAPGKAKAAANTAVPKVKKEPHTKAPRAARRKARRAQRQAATS